MVKSFNVADYGGGLTVDLFSKLIELGIEQKVTPKSVLIPREACNVEPLLSGCLFFDPELNPGPPASLQESVGDYRAREKERWLKSLHKWLEQTEASGVAATIEWFGHRIQIKPDPSIAPGYVVVEFA